MAIVNAVVSSIADNDRFLPRFLTIQLLAILAKAFPNSPTAPQVNNNGLIEAVRKSELFTPLTASIFWRENCLQVLESNTQPIDDLDKYNRSALTMALANEDFILANAIIAKDATVFLEDKLVLEIALTSIMQRDNSVLDKILEAAEDYDKPWIHEYLNHILNQVNGIETTQANHKYREVLNPTIRHFGQTLDTLVYFNGIPSHYGFIGPSLDILSSHLQEYTTQLQIPEAQKIFSAISEAFISAKQGCQFLGNIATNNNCGAEIISKIRSDENTINVVFGGWAGNCVAIAFFRDLLIITNLGSGGDPQNGSKIYQIKNKNAITAESLQQFISGLGYASSPASILGFLGDIVDAKPVYVINQFSNPVDNCIFVNPRAIIQGMLLVLSCYQIHKDTSANNLAAIAPHIAEFYTSYLNSLYQKTTKDLAESIRNSDLTKVKRVECCSLALEYINQHFNEADSLLRCIELKNALEFVGLKNFYQRRISPEAQQKIQEQIIREQELTAIHVIEQENTLLANQK